MDKLSGALQGREVSQVRGLGEVACLTTTFKMMCVKCAPGDRETPKVSRRQGNGLERTR